MNSQEWYLKQLGITQYTLRKPMALKGEALTDIPSNIVLIIIAKQRPTEKIFDDILKAINLSADNYLYLTPAQLIIPLEQLNCVTWFIDEQIPKEWLNSEHYLEKAIIQTESLNKLAKSPNHKRQLWKQFCQYENYFNITTN